MSIIFKPILSELQNLTLSSPKSPNHNFIDHSQINKKMIKNNSKTNFLNWFKYQKENKKDENKIDRNDFWVMIIIFIISV